MRLEAAEEQYILAGPVPLGWWHDLCSFIYKKLSYLLFNRYCSWLLTMTASILVVDFHICSYRKVAGEYLNSLLEKKLIRWSFKVLYLSCTCRWNFQRISWSWFSTQAVLFIRNAICWPQRKKKNAWQICMDLKVYLFISIDHYVYMI